MSDKRINKGEKEMIYLIYFVLILFFVLDYLKNKDLLTPIKLFNFIWLITLSAYQLKLSYIQTDLLPRTLLIFFVSIITFDLCSFLFAYIFKIKLKFSGIKISGNKFFSIKIEELVKIFSFVFLIIFGV